MYNQPSQLLDSDADNKVVDADLALQALGGDHVAFGYLTTTITVADTRSRPGRGEGPRGRADRQRARLHDASARASTRSRHGCRSLPGQVYANVRQPLVHTLNLAHLMPLSSVWAGPARNDHLGGPPLALRADRGLDAVPAVDPCRRRRAHAGGRADRRRQVGAARADRAAVPALSATPRSTSSTRASRRAPRCWRWAARITRSGSAARRRARRSRSSRCAGSIDATERSWAAEWIAALLAHEKVAVTPEVKEAVWSALGSLASAPPEERTLTGLALLLQSNALRTALSAYTLEGPYGRLLDAAEQRSRASPTSSASRPRR